ncbi:hypothetical protein BOTBODRAFT_143996 [Botryobasidium botryosum FD-172 SS1]|uniref:NAD(P)-binding protein n=1 Tax=Botryobasidium botryosum (strain FD-172 SS1) TaxID=930990 RepID=A0A067MPI7_BOTB1|nr:hypothetical protein BOTBODRAFT_143996 [Botryobasidium botryosum FD-172 SS1]
MPSAVYLVSGANRGIGLGFVTSLATRDNVIVLAGARNPSAATGLHTLVERHPGKVHIVKLTSCNKAENNNAIAEIKPIAGQLDVVIANAGISQYFGPAAETPVQQMRDHFEPLLKSSAPSPKFIAISSGAGSMAHGASMPMGILAYGASKAAENYLCRKLHFEHPELISRILLIEFTHRRRGLMEIAAFARSQDESTKQVPLITVEHCVNSVLKLVDDGMRETHGGKFLNYDGTTWEW